jgi:uncharacterized protein YjiS (DUF1127 family)
MEAVMTETDSSSSGVTPVMWSAQNWAARVFGGIHEVAADAAGILKSWRRQEALEHELQHLSDLNLADIGITRDQIPVVARSQDVPRLMRWMMARLGIPEAVLSKDDPALRQRLIRQCTKCYSRTHCRRWLRGGQRAEGYNQFCLNATEFEDLRARFADRQAPAQPF